MPAERNPCPVAQTSSPNKPAEGEQARLEVYAWRGHPGRPARRRAGAGGGYSATSPRTRSPLAASCRPRRGRRRVATTACCPTPSPRPTPTRPEPCGWCAPWPIATPSRRTILLRSALARRPQRRPLAPSQACADPRMTWPTSTLTARSAHILAYAGALHAAGGNPGLGPGCLIIDVSEDQREMVQRRAACRRPARRRPSSSTPPTTACRCAALRYLEACRSARGTGGAARLRVGATASAWRPTTAPLPGQASCSAGCAPGSGRHGARGARQTRGSCFGLQRLGAARQATATRRYPDRTQPRPCPPPQCPGLMPWAAAPRRR